VMTWVENASVRNLLAEWGTNLLDTQYYDSLQSFCLPTLLCATESMNIEEKGDEEEDDDRKPSAIQAKDEIPKAQKSRYPTRRRPRKQVSDGPARPLNAYNFFFREERERWLAEREAQGSNQEKSRVLFSMMGKEIAGRWKALSPKEVAMYKHMADKDSDRYHKERKAFVARAAEKTAREASNKKSKKSDDENVEGVVKKTPSASFTNPSIFLTEAIARVPDHGSHASQDQVAPHELADLSSESASQSVDNAAAPSPLLSINRIIQQHLNEGSIHLRNTSSQQASYQPEMSTRLHPNQGGLLQPSSLQDFYQAELQAVQDNARRLLEQRQFAAEQALQRYIYQWHQHDQQQQQVHQQTNQQQFLRTSRDRLDLLPSNESLNPIYTGAEPESIEELIRSVAGRSILTNRNHSELLSEMAAAKQCKCTTSRCRFISFSSTSDEKLCAFRS